eukprot:scaffold17400_cov110-Isochrysis_galbana.AAC.6
MTRSESSLRMSEVEAKMSWRGPMYGRRHGMPSCVSRKGKGSAASSQCSKTRTPVLMRRRRV